ncbi:tetratricopeptide repeat protein [Altererythrobacter lauratis]|uniref:Tetratricopeptide repeat protein n=1 Tax=Alteraurantiacibacter lauratis TaxID=2054627 RepID=A0ABV7EHZ1_9SPHN
MATTPNDPRKTAEAPDLAQQMLMREVDEAVRSDEVTNAARKYGWPVGIGLLLGLAAFGGYLWWDARTEAALERQSEMLVLAMDKLEAGQLDDADAELALIDGDVSPAAYASALMMRAAIAMQEERFDDAVTFYEQVIANEKAPQPMRDASLVRKVSIRFDQMQPQAIIDELQALARPGGPWFGSAGEMVAHAYLAQNKPELAGPLLVQIAQDETVPDSLRARTRQLAGFYGFDAIEDVGELMDSVASQDKNAAATGQ